MERRTIDIILVGVKYGALGAFTEKLMKSLNPELRGTMLIRSIEAVNTFTLALTLIEQHETLDIVYISNEAKASHVELAEGCKDLAKVMRRHPNKPWVTFEKNKAVQEPSLLAKPPQNLAFLTTIFRHNEVPVREETIGEIVRMRWRAQEPRAFLS